MLAIRAVSGWLSHLMPAELKSVLVFWRWHNVLPGYRFIQLSEKDRRIGTMLLKVRVSEFDLLKQNNSEQNSYWYKEFYRLSNKQDEVASTHRAYLLSGCVFCQCLCIAGREAILGRVSFRSKLSIFMGVCLGNHRFLYCSKKCGEQTRNNGNCNKLKCLR